MEAPAGEGLLGQLLERVDDGQRRRHAQQHERDVEDPGQLVGQEQVGDHDEQGNGGSGVHHQTAGVPSLLPEGLPPGSAHGAHARQHRPGRRRAGGDAPTCQDADVLPARIETTDYHTGGEPFRIVVDPPVPLPGPEAPPGMAPPPAAPSLRNATRTSYTCEFRCCDAADGEFAHQPVS